MLDRDIETFTAHPKYSQFVRSFFGARITFHNLAYFVIPENGTLYVTPFTTKFTVPE